MLECVRVGTVALLAAVVTASASTGCSSDRRRGGGLDAAIDAARRDSGAGDAGIEDASTGFDAAGAESVCDDGLDNDGDELVDEGCPCEPETTQECYGGSPDRAGVGACELGTQRCVARTETIGVWAGGCGGWIEPADETCNDVDDDCDGTVDGLRQFCPDASGETLCTAGEWSTCEMCNGVDDDGDGAVDESLVRACGEDCRDAGFQTCEGALWGECTTSRSFDPSIDRGGVVVDAASVAPEQSVDSLVLSHTTSASLTDALLLVAVAVSEPTTITSVTYGGTGLTELASWTADSTFEELHLVVFYLLDPPAGTADVVVTLPGTFTVDAGAYTMGNVSGAPIALGSARERSTDPALDVDASPGGLIVDFLGKEAEHGISPAPISELGWDLCGPGYARFGSSLRAADGPTSLWWIYDCCPDEWILGAVLVTPRE